MTHTAAPLALFGGPPELPAGPPSWPVPDPQVAAALAAAYADGSWGRYHGPHCGRLAAALAERWGTDHVLLCCSGTIAVELALRGVRVQAGDEVILAGYDFPGNFRAIEAIGARPVLVDLDPDNWNLDPRALRAAIGPQTKAILVSHLHGGLAPMDEVRAVAAEHGLAVVEDACQAAGATLGGRPAGSGGDAGVLSFGGSKLLTAGRGGAVLTRRPDVAQRMKIFAERGNQAFPLSELQAAVLLPQLAQLDGRHARRRRAAQRLYEAVERLGPWLRPLRNRVAGADPAFYKLGWQYCPQPLAGGAPSSSRDSFAAFLRAEGVALDAGFRGFAGRSERRCRAVGPLPESRAAAERMLVLHHPVLLADDETLDGVIRAFAKVLAAVAAGLIHEQAVRVADPTPESDG